MNAAGTVISLHRWPVKSLGGEPADALRIDGRGAGGDRAQALHGIFGGKRRPLTVRQVPRMLAWAAAYPQAPGEALDPDAPPLPVLTGPDGRTWDWDDPGLPGALRDDLNRPVDLRRFRTNLHLELDAPAFAEAGWEGRRVRVGEAELEVLHACERCAIPTRDPDTSEKWPELLRRLAREHDTVFGINARAVHPATVRVGDPVTVV